MIKEAIIKLTNKENLSYEEAKAVMNEIMSGEASDVQKSAYLTALTMKGETIDEITGSAEEMRNHAVQLSHEGDVLEIVGTGGDKSDSFNISTTSSLVIASAGVPVAKHGNRAASSKSGAADGKPWCQYHDFTPEECRAAAEHWYLLSVCTELSYSNEICGIDP